MLQLKTNIWEYLELFFYSFSIFFILFFPIGNTLQNNITSLLFEKSISAISTHFLHWPCASLVISSDSRAMYIFCGILCFIALPVLFLLKKNKIFQHYFYLYVSLVINYYLVFVLWQYGWDKITMQQFYTPEPNILFSTIGNTHLDTLYWSTMGLSTSYCIFIGVVEIIAGVFILMKATRFIGILMATIIFINVVAVNFCFDINVKLFSTFLLLISLLEIAPYMVFIYKSVRHHLPISFEKKQYCFYRNVVYLKVIIVIYFITNITTPFLKIYLQKQKQTIYGGYRVLNNSCHQTIKNIFIHKDNYLIIQKNNDAMQDDAIKINTNQKFIKTINANKISKTYFYNTDEYLQMQSITMDKDTLLLQKINLINLPALQQEFHWSIEGY